MLRPVVRGLGRRTPAKCQCNLNSRQIHVSSIRAIDDPDHSSSPKSSKESEVTSTTEKDDTTAKKSAEPIPSTQVPIGQNVNDSQFSWDPSDPSFKARQQEREAKIEEDRKVYNLPVESREERNQKYRDSVYQMRKKKQEEANKRGEEVFAMVNAARAARGEPPIGQYAREEEERFRRPKQARNTPPGRRERDQRPPRRREEWREERRERPARSDKKRSVAKRYEQRAAQVKEQKQEHVFAPNFDPSESMVQGLDEVDFEVAYELPDPITVKDKFAIANRDGTVKHRRTNRDFDELPEDAGSYIDMQELGPIGRSFYAPELPPMETDEEIPERIENTEYPEDQEADLDELMQIKEEIEAGLTPEERLKARREREIIKAVALRDKQYSEGVNEGTWSKLVPLPVAHRPETKDIDDYKAPFFSQESFTYGVPPIPFGSRGRLEAANEAAFHDLSEPVIPSNLNAVDLEPQNEQELQDLDSVMEDLKDLVNMMDANIPETEEESLPKFNKNAKPPPLKTTRGRTTVYDPQHLYEIEDMYSDDQLAIWKEMNKDSFAPANVKVPVYENEEEEISFQLEEREAAERLEVYQVGEQLDAAMLRRFRRRDEWEIRDIRRRLGLPIVNGTYMEEPYYEKKSLTTPSPIDPEPKVHEGELADLQKPVVDNTKIRLAFWRDTKEFVAKLTSRINILRAITQETYDRLRRHGTAQLQLQSGAKVTETTIVENPETGIMARLHQQFLDVHKKLENLEMLSTAVQLGPGGPMDPEYSAAWVEANLHKEEAAEFEETARKMGYPANSIPMEPVFSAEEQKELKDMTKAWYERNARIAIAGEYHDVPNPGEGMPFPLGLASRYAANAGLDEYQKTQRVYMLAQTLEGKGIPFEDPVEMKERRAREEEEGAREDTESEEGVQAVVQLPSVETEEALAAQAFGDIEDRPQQRISHDFANVMKQLRASMQEIDNDIISLEKNYDKFLESRSAQSPLPTSQNSTTKEAST